MRMPPADEDAQDVVPNCSQTSPAVFDIVSDAGVHMQQREQNTQRMGIRPLESSRSSQCSVLVLSNATGLARNGGRLLDHCRGMLMARAKCGLSSTAIVSIIAILLVSWAFGQSVPRPKFDVASVKLDSDPNMFSGVTPLPGGRLRANATLRTLMTVAYDVKSFQISGGPSWVNSEHYQIDAKANGEANAEQMRPMLQSLLEDRFKLAVHRETKPLPVYTLAVARAGKLKQATNCSIPGADPNAPAPPPPPPPPPGQPPSFTPPCGFLALLGPSLEGTSVTMADLADRLSFLLGRTVKDHTAFKERFDVHLRFALDASLEGLSLQIPLQQPNPDSSDPSLTVALREQLGLNLSSAREPTEVIAIDYVEKPSGN
jgi:uncharacterized protein (TIGR03435 family)